MFWSRTFIVIGLIAALSIFLSCAGTPVLDRNWGKSFQAKKSNQIINPEAEENLEPVTELHGKAAEGVLEKYNQSERKVSHTFTYEFEIGQGQQSGGSGSQ